MAKVLIKFPQQMDHSPEILLSLIKSAPKMKSGTPISPRFDYKTPRPPAHLPSTARKPTWGAPHQFPHQTKSIVLVQIEPRRHDPPNPTSAPPVNRPGGPKFTFWRLTLTRRASQHGHLCARRGVRGGVLGLWQGLRYPRITQRVRVGELDPKLYSLGVGG